MSRPSSFPLGLRRLLLRSGIVNISQNLRTFVCPFRRPPDTCCPSKRPWCCSNRSGPFSQGNLLNTLKRRLRIACIVVRLIPEFIACVNARALLPGGRCSQLWCDSGRSCLSSRLLLGCFRSRMGGVNGRLGWTPFPCLTFQGATLLMFRFCTLTGLVCSPGTQSFGLLRGLSLRPSRTVRFRLFGMVYSRGLVRLFFGRSSWRCRAPLAPLGRLWSSLTLCPFAVLPPGFCCSLGTAFHRCYRPITKICGLTSSLLSGEWTSRVCGCGGSKGMSTIALLSVCVRSTRGSTIGLTLLLSSLCVATLPLFSSTLWKIFVSSSLRPRTCSLSRQGLPFSLRMTGTPQLCVNRSWSGLSAWWVSGLSWSSNMTFTPLFVTRVLQGPSLIGCGRSAGPRLPTLVAWVSFKTLRGLNFFGAMFMIRRRSRPFCTIMSGFGFRMTLLWSSQFHLSRRCSVLGSVLSMLSSRQVSRCLGPGTCPKSGPFAHSVRVLTVLGSMGVSSCRRWLCRTFLPNSLFRRVFRQCGCLHLISFQQRSTRSRNTRQRAHRSHTRAWLWDECPRE